MTERLDSVGAVVDRLETAAQAEEVALGDVIEALGDASFVPVLMAPALAVVTPLSGIPVFSSICGLLIALVAAQMLFNRDHLWLPGVLKRRSVKGDRIRRAVEKMRRPADWLDRHSHERLTVFVRRPFRWITQGACLLCGAAMPLLELIPFTSSILGAAVVLFSLSLLVRDGVFSLLAMGVVGLAGWVGWTLAG